LEATAHHLASSGSKPVGTIAKINRSTLNHREAVGMSILKWALVFFVISIIAGILGFTGVSAASADIARVLFYIFAVIFLILLILGFTIFRT
jgi:uncharacterized membrane protein YtjA (UPF0391 family)